MGDGRLAVGLVPATPLAYRLSPNALFALHPRDDFVAHVLRRGLVSIEVHRVARASLGPRPQVRCIAEHLGQRHARRDDLRTAAILLRLDLAAPAREVA